LRWQPGQRREHQDGTDDPNHADTSRSEAHRPARRTAHNHTPRAIVAFPALTVK
jgi:hypothetical protein